MAARNGWIYMENLAFLEPFIASRQNTSNSNNSSINTLEHDVEIVEEPTDHRNQHNGFFAHLGEILNDVPQHKVNALKKKIIELAYSELDD